MKNKLYIMNNQQGFFLPYVLFLTSIIFILLMTNIKIYQNEVMISHNLMEQIEIETLFQMGITSFKKDLQTGEVLQEGRYEYHFPPGFVKIDYQITGDFIHSSYEITTKKDSNSSSMVSIINLSNLKSE